MLELLDDMDTLLATNENFLLGIMDRNAPEKWVQMKRKKIIMKQMHEK